MAWILITPSSRGIGHAMTRHLLRTTPSTIPIVATTRASDPSTTKSSILFDLNLPNSDSASSRLDIQPCDLLSESSIESLASYCRERYQPTKNNKSAHLRLACLFPGQLYPEKSPSQIDYDNALSTLKLNLLAPMMLLKHFHPFLPSRSTQLESHPDLPDSAVMAFMSARVGSISDNGLGGWYSYRSSKAGLNQLVKSADLFQRTKSGEKACMVGLHPGTVKTELSREFWAGVKEGKLFSPEFSVEKLWKVLKDVGVDTGLRRGRCWDWEGKEVPP